MKKFVTLSLAAALALSLAVSTSAVDGEGEILKGTPKIDGKLDDLYTYDTLCVKIGGDLENAYGTNSPYDWNGSASADVYFLYDAKNLYICAVATDDDVLTKGEAYASDRANNPVNNDNIEFRLSFDGSGTTGTAVKVAIDAYGYGVYGLPAHYDKIDYDAIEFATTINDNGYIIECAIPCTKGDLDMIKAGKLGFTYQMNDLDANGVVKQHTASFYGEPVKTPVLYNLSDKEAKAPAAPTPSTPDVPAAGGTTAPSTFDPALIAVALTAASGAAFVFASKKH